MGWVSEGDGPAAGPDWWPAGYGQLWALQMHEDHQAQAIGDYLEPDWTLNPFRKESPGLEL